MTLPNIALTGHLRSGKDSTADYLVENYGYTRFAFGDELKRLYHDIFGASDAKPREGYQWFGQTMRQRDPDVWVRKCFAAIESKRFWREYYEVEGDPEPELPVRAVITDLRQPNELARCRAEGYVIVRVKAMSGLRIQRAIGAADTFRLADLTHETESHIDGFAVDYEITNDGTLAELYVQIDEVIKRVGADEE